MNASSLLGKELQSLERTCLALPSQWDAKIEDGPLYIRYRHGVLTVEDVPLGTLYFESKHGHPLDGWMSTVEMLSRTGLLWDGDADELDRIHEDRIMGNWE